MQYIQYPIEDYFKEAVGGPKTMSLEAQVEYTFNATTELIELFDGLYDETVKGVVGGTIVQFPVKGAFPIIEKQSYRQGSYLVSFINFTNLKLALRSGKGFDQEDTEDFFIGLSIALSEQGNTMPLDTQIIELPINNDRTYVVPKALQHAIVNYAINMPTDAYIWKDIQKVTVGSSYPTTFRYSAPQKGALDGGIIVVSSTKTEPDMKQVGRRTFANHNLGNVTASYYPVEPLQVQFTDEDCNTYMVLANIGYQVHFKHSLDLNHKNIASDFSSNVCVFPFNGVQILIV